MFFRCRHASVAATVAPMPMGLGTFEAGMMATLNVFGMSIEGALTATLLFRGLSLWLPLIPGFYIIQTKFSAKTSKLRRTHQSPNRSAVSITINTDEKRR